jgi:hypothetical protein
LDVLQEVFYDLVLADQDLFEKREKWEELISLLPADKPPANKKVVAAIEWEMVEHLSSVDKWKKLKTAIKKETGADSPERVSSDIDCV